jgi:hypothetical protein
MVGEECLGGRRAQSVADDTRLVLVHLDLWRTKKSHGPIERGQHDHVLPCLRNSHSPIIIKHIFFTIQTPRCLDYFTANK